jgi:hypothetical protein
MALYLITSYDKRGRREKAHWLVEAPSDPHLGGPYPLDRHLDCIFPWQMDRLLFGDEAARRPVHIKPVEVDSFEETESWLDMCYRKMSRYRLQRVSTGGLGSSPNVG